MTDFKDKIVLITGASKGVGRGIALKLAAAGYTLVLNYSSDDAAAQETQAAVQKLGAECLLMKADVSQASGVETLFQQAVDRFGRLDAVVSNAGMEIISRKLWDHSEADYDRLFDLNVKGTFHVLKQAATRVVDGGRIVVISSSNTLHPIAGMSLYAGTKAAIKMFAEILAKEVAPRQVTVNSVLPGAVEGAGVVADITAEERAEFLKGAPMGRLGTPEDTGNVVKFLLSDEASFVSGHHLLVNGSADL
jgi:3-oxoacyl-[acyl-carrier protein] reductase